MKVALYRNIVHNYDCVSSDLEGIDDYVRLSEFSDVEFVMLPYGEAEKKQADFIDKEISKHLAKINCLEKKKAELLAISFDGENK